MNKTAVALQAPGTPDSIPTALSQGPQKRQVLAGAEILTGAFHALVHQPVQEGAAVVAEGGAAVAVQAELVLVPGVLGAQESRSEGAAREAGTHGE